MAGLPSAARIDALNPFDRIQLVHAVATCRDGRSLSDAGRRPFAASRRQRTSTNDAHGLRKYLARFDLDWAGRGWAGLGGERIGPG